MKKDLYITTPSFFRCPISLEVMKSPVILSTGVTYDRANIQRWLDSGNNTCPATMQLLDSKDFVPNHTLDRLIKIWSHKKQQQFHSLSYGQVLELITRVSVSEEEPETRVESFLMILGFATESERNKKFISSNIEFVRKLVDIIASEGPDLNSDLLEAIIKIFELVTSVIDTKQKKVILLRTNPNLIPNMGKILKTAMLDSKIAVVRILQTTAIDQESKKAIFDDWNIIQELLKMLSDETEIHAVLSCLISVSSSRGSKVKLVEAGIVSIITNIVSKPDNDIKNKSDSMALLLTMLEMLAGCTEGRIAITDNPNCVNGVVQKLLKVSRVGHEHAIAMLWTLCYLFRDQKAREIMTNKNGGLTKILLLMQSDCTPNVKKMCCDLIRIFRVNSKSCLFNYDTKTSHIMPC